MTAARKGAAAVEVHDLEPDQFLEEVHSFEFWFEAVDGYLGGLTYGHAPAAYLPAVAEPDRSRLITALCNYCVGETAALEGASGLVAIAPNRLSKIFLATQAVDEARHVEVFLHRLKELGVKDPEAEVNRQASPGLLQFKRRLLELVAGKDWEAAIFAQNVILEALEYTVFQSHARDADPITREVLQGVIKDERRHIGFGENELGRRLKQSPHIRARIGEVKRELDRVLLDAVEDTMRLVGTSADERHQVVRSYLDAVGRLGFA